MKMDGYDSAGTYPPCGEGGPQMIGVGAVPTSIMTSFASGESRGVHHGVHSDCYPNHLYGETASHPAYVAEDHANIQFGFDYGNPAWLGPTSSRHAGSKLAAVSKHEATMAQTALATFAPAEFLGIAQLTSFAQSHGRQLETVLSVVEWVTISLNSGLDASMLFTLVPWVCSAATLEPGSPKLPQGLVWLQSLLNMGVPDERIVVLVQDLSRFAGIDLHCDLSSPVSLPSANATPEVIVKKVPCLIGSYAGTNTPRCPGHFELSPHDISGLQRHLLTYHPEPASGEVDCPWPGCRCSPQARRGGRCDGRNDDHPAHMQASHRVNHILDAHLNFRHVCLQCQRADWTSAFRLGSHKCTGKIQARCTECLDLFPADFELVRHQVCGECPGRY